MRRLLAIALLVAACGGGGAVSTVSPTSAVTPEVTLEPEPLPEFGGTGLITFGTAYDPDTLEIPKPLTRFKRTFPEIAWSADLTRAVGATMMTLVIASQSKTGVEQTLLSEETEVGNPDFTILANSADLAFLVDNKAGTYVMRYIESGDILAEGTFTLVK